MAETLNTGILKESLTRDQGSGRNSDQGARVGLGPEAQGVREGLGSWCQLFRAGIGPGAQGVGAGLGPNPTDCESNVRSSRQPA